jgi:hypothetical protein
LNPQKSREIQCPETESNRRHGDFQAAARGGIAREMREIRGEVGRIWAVAVGEWRWIRTRRSRLR